MCLPSIRVLKVRKSLPAEFSYIIQELLHESSIEPNKHAYINVIISTIITTKRADDFIIAMCNLIQRLTIDSLHIVGERSTTVVLVRISSWILYVIIIILIFNGETMIFFGWVLLRAMTVASLM